MVEPVTDSAGLPVNASCNFEMKEGSGLYVLRTSFFLLTLAAKEPDRFMYMECCRRTVREPTRHQANKVVWSDRCDVSVAGARTRELHRRSANARAKVATDIPT